MNPSTRLQLQTQLEEIKSSQTAPESSPLAYRAAWIALILAVPLIALWIIPPWQDRSRAWPLLVFFYFFAQSLYIIIQYKVSNRLRPILEALLYIQEEPPKQEHSGGQKPKRLRRARPTRR